MQLWFEPFFDGTSWDGPAWSISAEWLAYLLFGALDPGDFPDGSTLTRARSLMLLAFVASLPPVVLLLTSGQFYTPWSWLPRIVTQFVAGALACAAVRRLRLTDRGRRIAGYVSAASARRPGGPPLLLDAHPISGVVDSGGVVDMLFVPLVITLAVGVGSLPEAAVDAGDGLRRPDLVLPVHGSRAGAHLVGVGSAAVPAHPVGLRVPWRWNVIGLLVITVGISILLYHFVEEPARRWMRRMVDVRAGDRKGPARRVGQHQTSPDRRSAEGVSARAV